MKQLRAKAQFFSKMVRKSSRGSSTLSLSNAIFSPSFSAAEEKGNKNKKEVNKNKPEFRVMRSYFQNPWIDC